MLAALAVNWPFLILRAAIAVLFAVAALSWPVVPSIGMVLLFGAYALADGFLALVVALTLRGLPGFGGTLLEALVRIAAGVVAFANPALTALMLRQVFAVWAILSGVAALVTARALARDLSGEWPLPLAGAMSVISGAMLMLGVAPPELPWVLGPYALLFAATLLVLALRLRQLAEEMATS
jgi:uncharacterized membrane protein HdeD (DUF308 family)